MNKECDLFYVYILLGILLLNTCGIDTAHKDLREKVLEVGQVCSKVAE